MKWKQIHNMLDWTKPRILLACSKHQYNFWKVTFSQQKNDRIKFLNFLLHGFYN